MGDIVRLADARDVYVARTYAYVANGKEGVAIIDVEQPEKPKLDRTFTADGLLNDTHQVKVAMTNASLFAYVADGRNGLRVLQLTSPETMPNYAGFSRDRNEMIATFKTKGEAWLSPTAGSRPGGGRERKPGSVFGRRGARPFNSDELGRIMRTHNGTGNL